MQIAWKPFQKESFASFFVLPSDAYRRSLKTYLKQSRQDRISKWWLLTNLTQLIHGKYKSLHCSSFLRPSIEFVKLANIYFHLFPVLVGHQDKGNNWITVNLIWNEHHKITRPWKVKHWGFVCSPFFSPFLTPAFARPTFAPPIFFARLSKDYKKTKGLLVV